MAPHSSALAWKIPWTDEPGRLHAVHGVATSWTRLKPLSSSSSRAIYLTSGLLLLSHTTDCSTPGHCYCQNNNNNNNEQQVQLNKLRKSEWGAFTSYNNSRAQPKERLLSLQWLGQWKAMDSLLTIKETALFSLQKLSPSFAYGDLQVALHGLFPELQLSANPK